MRARADVEIVTAADATTAVGAGVGRSVGARVAGADGRGVGPVGRGVGAARAGVGRAVGPSQPGAPPPPQRESPAAAVGAGSAADDASAVGELVHPPAWSYSDGGAGAGGFGSAVAGAFCRA